MKTIYLDKDHNPVDKEVAVMAKIIRDDGTRAYVSVGKNSLLAFSEAVNEFRRAYGRKGKVGGSSKTPTTAPIEDEEIEKKIAKKLKSKIEAYKKNKKVISVQEFQEDRMATAPEFMFSKAYDKYREFRKKGAYKGEPDFLTLAVNAYEFEDEQTGWKSVIVAIDENNRNNSYIQIDGAILDKDGKEVGNFQRYIKVDEVHNSMLSLDIQKNGFGTRFYKHQEDVLFAAGAKKITIFANLSVGAYAWARMGYDANGAYYKKKLSNLVSTWWEDDYQRALIVAEGLGKKLKYKKPPKVNHTWEIASMISPWDNYLRGTDSMYDVRFGKRLLLDDSFDAVKYLGFDRSGNVSDGVIAGEIYYELKGIL